MRKYLLDYVKEVEADVLQNKKYTDYELEDLICKIGFMQHERLIHLLVTLSFAFFTLLFLAFSLLSYLFLIPFFSLIVFLLFYIRHYFLLENKVQYLYKLYDKIIAIRT